MAFSVCERSPVPAIFRLPGLYLRRTDIQPIQRSLKEYRHSPSTRISRDLDFSACRFSRLRTARFSYGFGYNWNTEHSHFSDTRLSIPASRRVLIASQTVCLPNPTHFANVAILILSLIPVVQSECSFSINQTSAAFQSISPAKRRSNTPPAPRGTAKDSGLLVFVHRHEYRIASVMCHLERPRHYCLLGIASVESMSVAFKSTSRT